MRTFLIRRLLFGLFITVAGALIIYSVIRMLPTSYVEAIARQRATNPLSTKTYQEWLDQLNAVYGLDRGIIPGFAKTGGKNGVSNAPGRIPGQRSARGAALSGLELLASWSGTAGTGV